MLWYLYSYIASGYTVLYRKILRKKMSGSDAQNYDVYADKNIYILDRINI
jgi:hypothetical protein